LLSQGLRARLHELEDGHESLLAASYWILTKIESEFGGRKPAAQKLQIEWPVLHTLGRLSAQNDPIEGRKAKDEIKPLTEGEKMWVRAVVPLLALRAIEIESGCVNLPVLRMSDLPSIP